MAALVKTSVKIDISVAKTSGLANLGVPVDDSTQVKKGKLQEFMQNLDSEAIARRYQNIRITAVKASEAGRTFAKLFVQFEVFGDDWNSVGDNAGIEYGLTGDGKALHSIEQAKIFLPYCRFWYENQFEYTIPTEVFDAMTSLEFVAKADEVQAG